MILAFYKVVNSRDYDRDEFWDSYDEPSVILNKLSLLNRDEVRLYNMSDKFSVDNFQEDYNDEILDGGCWCVSINK